MRHNLHQLEATGTTGPEKAREKKQPSLVKGELESQRHCLPPTCPGRSYKHNSCPSSSKEAKRNGERNAPVSFSCCPLVSSQQPFCQIPKGSKAQKSKGDTLQWDQTPSPAQGKEDNGLEMGVYSFWKDIEFRPRSLKGLPGNFEALTGPLLARSCLLWVGGRLQPGEKALYGCCGNRSGCAAPLDPLPQVHMFCSQGMPTYKEVISTSRSSSDWPLAILKRAQVVHTKNSVSKSPLFPWLERGW